MEKQVWSWREHGKPLHQNMPSLKHFKSILQNVQPGLVPWTIPFGFSRQSTGRKTGSVCTLSFLKTFTFDLQSIIRHQWSQISISKYRKKVKNFTSTKTVFKVKTRSSPSKSTFKTSCFFHENKSYIETPPTPTSFPSTPIFPVLSSSAAIQNLNSRPENLEFCCIFSSGFKVARNINKTNILFNKIN